MKSIQQSSRYRAAIKELFEEVELYCRLIRIDTKIKTLKYKIDKELGITRL